MAALKENLLSPWHLTHKERDPLSTSTKRGERSLKKSEHQRMELQRDQYLRTVGQLQKRWQQLQERECRAQQHNRQLLQEFEKAQDTLRDMVARTATMNTIRMEYERYLEENSPRWQQQLKEKTLSAQKKRMEEYLTECLKRIEEEQVRSSSEAQPSLSQGHKQPQKTAAPQRNHNQSSHADHNQDDSSHLRVPSMQSSWLTRHSHSASFPSRMPSDPQGSSYVPLSFYPPPVFQQPHPFSSIPSHRHSVPQQGPPGWSALQMDHTHPWPGGAAGFPSGADTLWTQPFMAEPPGWGVVQGVEEEAERSTRSSSVQGCGKGGRSRGLSQELDIKPVRLSSGQKESSESGRDSSQASRKNGIKEKRKKREKTRRTEPSSSDKDSSQETSSVVVVASASVAQGSGSDTSSGKDSSSRSRRGRRSGGLSVKPPRMEKPRESSKGDSSGSCKEDCPTPEKDSGSEEVESRSEITGNQSPDDKSESCTEESGSPMEKSGSGSEKVEDGRAEETEEEQGSSDNQSSPGDKDEEEEGHEEEVVETRKDVEEADDDEENEESSQTDDEEEDPKGEDDDKRATGRKNMAEEETDEEEEQESEGQEEDEEQSGRETDEGSEDDKEGSATSQDGEMEDGGKGNADKKEEDEELDEEEEGGGEEEEQRSEEAGKPEEERDSDDSIILPQAHRPKNMIHSIPEEGEATSEDEDGEEESKKECSDESSNEFKDEDDDIESLLAPQSERPRKEEKDLKADDKPKAIIEDLDDFSVEPDRETKTDQEDSDEFDHFYD